MIKIAPSMLSANFAVLSEELKSIEAAGADLLHIDIMDGHFVPNLTFGAPIVKAIRPYTKLPFDVHLMVTNPGDYVEEFEKIGVEYFTFHQETVPHMHRLIQHIKQCGMTVSYTHLDVYKRQIVSSVGDARLVICCKWLRTMVVNL